MYASLRKYEIKPGLEADLIQSAEREFLPIIKKAAGFVSYFIVSAGNNFVNTVSIFDEESQVKASDQLAAEWVSENMAQFVVGTPEITQGEIVLEN